jgi:hypothetical protein
MSIVAIPELGDVLDARPVLRRFEAAESALRE